MIRYRLAGFAVLMAAVVSACASGGGRAVPPAAGALRPSGAGHLQMISRTLGVDTESGAFVRGMLPRDAVALGANAPLAVATPPLPLAYYGGPVQDAPRVYLIFWGAQWVSANPADPPGTPGTGDPRNVQAYATSFVTAAAGSRWLNDVLQYTALDGSYAGNPATMLKAVWFDGSTVPASATGTDLQAEVLNAARHFSDVGGNVNYVIFLPAGVGAPNYPKPWCAYHTYRSNLQGRLIPYTVMPYIADQGSWCGAGAVNNPGALDGVSIVLGHEIAETLTDPHIYTPGGVPTAPTAWDDVANEEIGDKCSWTGLVNNQYVANFPTQPLWDNSHMKCRQGPPAPSPAPT